VYHFELYRVLTSWLSPAVATQIELNAPLGVEGDASANERRSDSRRRCDMKLAYGQKEVLIELVATETQAIIKKHFLSAKEYGKALKAEEVWVVIFTVMDRSQFQLVWPAGEALGVRVMYIFHSDNWERQDVVLQPTNNRRATRISRTSASGSNLGPSVQQQKNLKRKPVGKDNKKQSTTKKTIKRLKTENIKKG